MRLLIIVILACALLNSCKNNTDQPTSPKIAANLDSTTLQSGLLNKYFNDKEIAGISELVSAYSSEICPEDDRISRCLELHLQGLKGDFMQSRTIDLNFPYNSDFTISSLSANVIVESIWSEDCKLINDADEVIDFYCFQPTGPFVEYLRAKAQKDSRYTIFLDNAEQQRNFDGNTIFNLLSTDQYLNMNVLGDQFIICAAHLNLDAELRAKKALGKTKSSAE